MIPVPEKRVAEFEEKAFGMFIHYGLYSQLGEGEWIKHFENIPDGEYNKLFETFDPSGFDARAIARLAKRAGMKYITLTTRHHEGFSLYDTCGLSDFDAPHAPNCRRDLIREFVDGCNEEGITPMFYHTTLDWHQKSFNGDFPAYLQYLRDSVEVLCTNYGKIGGLWFDGNWSKPDADWEEDKLYAVIRRHQPDAIIVNNTGLEARGRTGNKEIDSVTYEQGRPEPMNREGMSKYVAAEMCYTMNDHWGIGKLDLNYKSLPSLIETLCACRKAGANLLLNVGPAADGSILPIQQCLLSGMGDWINNFGACIYKAKPCDVKGEGKDFALRDNDKLYLFLHDLTTAGKGAVRTFNNVCGKAESIKYTDNNEKLDFTQENKQLCVNTPSFPYGTNGVVRVAEVKLSV
ncbi:MAG: alpha-L-fucosidase [Clostridia bacterium]|nr:alpha-L-fucosidase [Clostridia bacterium]